VIANTNKTTRNNGQLKKIEKKDKESDLLFFIVKLLKKIIGTKITTNTIEFIKKLILNSKNKLVNKEPDNNPILQNA
jgi:hypothetical protein